MRNEDVIGAADLQRYALLANAHRSRARRRRSSAGTNRPLNVKLTKPAARRVQQEDDTNHEARRQPCLHRPEASSHAPDTSHSVRRRVRGLPLPGNMQVEPSRFIRTIAGPDRSQANDATRVTRRAHERPARLPWPAHRSTGSPRRPAPAPASARTAHSGGTPPPPDGSPASPAGPRQTRRHSTNSGTGVPVRPRQQRP